MITFNPNDKHENVELFNNNMQIDLISNIYQYCMARATEGKISGKWYWEVTAAHPSGNIGVEGFGVADESALLKKPNNTNNLVKEGWLCPTFYNTPPNTVFGILLDLDNKKFTYYKNNSFFQEYDSSFLTGEIFASIAAIYQNDADFIITNFGATPFNYEMPEGYLPYDLVSAKASWFYEEYFLIKTQDNKIQYLFDNMWVDTGLTEPLTEQNFRDYKMKDLSVITSDQWVELGDNFEVLMWTDAVNPELCLSATVPEYKPFDLIDNPYDLEILTWTDGEELVLSATGDTDILAAVDSTNPEVLVWTNDGVISTGQISGILDKPLYDYQVEIDNSITPENPDKILIPWTQADGDISNIAIIPAGYVNSMNPYIVKVLVKEADGDVIESTGQILLYNTEPSIVGEFAGGWVTGLLGDPEDDKIQYSIYLNDNKIYPLDTDFTELIPSPIDLDFEIPLEHILLGQQNNIVIKTKDEFGLEGSLELNFIGDYFGLMFSDVNGEYYSDNAGNILKYLDMGAIVAGQTTLPVEIMLKNNTRYAVNNMKLFRDRKTLPNNVDIELSKTETPFIASDVLLFPDVMDKGSQVAFYVRVTSSNQAVGTGDFDIYVNSDIAE